MNQLVQASGGSQPSPQPSNTTSNPNAQQQQHLRGQQQQQPNQAQWTHFEGAIPELQGHIYDLVRLCSADLFMMMTRVVAVYVGCELGGDI